MQRQFTDGLGRHTVGKGGQLTLVAGLGELAQVEEILALRPFVQRILAKVDAAQVDVDVDDAIAGFLVQHHGAAVAVDLAAPDRNAHVVGFEAGKGVVGIDGVVGGRSLDGAACQAGSQGQQQQFLHHGFLVEKSIGQRQCSAPATSDQSLADGIKPGRGYSCLLLIQHYV